MPLAAIVRTAELEHRARRPADYRTENEALVKLAEGLADKPDRVLQQLAEAALTLCRAGSAGVSLVERGEGEACFRWRATAGAFKSLLGHSLPRDHSPCGVVLDRDEPVLMVEPAQYFEYLRQLDVPVHEVLLVPFHHDGEAIGTVWIVGHQPDHRFDAEDLRLVTSLSRFAAAVHSHRTMQAAVAQAQEMVEEQKQFQVAAGRELQDTQARARLMQARFEAFFDQSPYYAGLLDLAGNVVEVGRIALETCGYRREEVVNHPFWDTPWWRHSRQVQEQLRHGFACARAGQAYNTQLSYVFANGDEHVAEVGLSPVLDAQGKVQFITAIGNDVTHRVVAEHELATTRRRLQSALIAAELGVYEWDVPNDRIWGDENCLRLFGLTPTADGTSRLDVFLGRIHPDDRSGTIERIAQSVRTGENFETDYRVARPEGGYRWINSRGRMVRNDAGAVVAFTGVVLDITARKEAEAAREAIAAELRRMALVQETVLSATNDFAYIFDRGGRFLYANRELLKVWAKTLDQVVGKTCHELDYPEWHADMHLREINEILRTKQPIRGEVPFTGASGISGIYDYIFTPVLGPDGEVEVIVGTTRDVTERRRSEDRDQFLVALDDATRPLTDPTEITQTNARLLGQHLKVNRCAYADVEADEDTFNLTGDFSDGVPSIVGRYRFQQFGDACLQAMRAGQPYIVTDSEQDPRTEQVRDAYRATNVRAVICVPLGKSGKFVAAMAVHQAEPRSWQSNEVELVQQVAARCWESIERSRVLRELAVSEQRLRLAVETARLGVWELDLQNLQLTCSAQCKANYGRTADQPFTYEGLWQTVHPDDRDRAQAAERQAIRAGVEYEVEYRALWPDQTVHWMLVRGHASHGADGTPLRMIGVSLDITERKQAEHELARLHDEAVRASRAKDDFLATLSHELRTPLNPVLLIASEGANELDLPAEARESFEVIRKNVELEARLIDDLLDLTSIVRGKILIRPQPTDINRLLEEAAAALRSDLEAKGQTLQLQLPPETVRVQGDADRLLQVFLNLLRNAAKFTPPSGIIVITARCEAPEQVEVSVSDSGIGMTEAELARVFEAFEQGDHALVPGAHRFGGLGLGLAIARQLVELHGGTIRALSPGRDEGCTFVVRLPRLPEGADVTPPLAPPTRSPATLPGTSPATVRVLLVEDHEPTRNALVHLLRRRAYLVTVAGSLREARAQIDHADFDVLISDLGLPDGDGTELMQEMQARRPVKGIALTGYGMGRDVARCRAAGFASHLTKPVRIEALEAALQALGA